MLERLSLELFFMCGRGHWSLKIKRIFSTFAACKRLAEPVGLIWKFCNNRMHLTRAKSTQMFSLFDPDNSPGIRLHRRTQCNCGNLSWSMSFLMSFRKITVIIVVFYVFLKNFYLSFFGCYAPTVAVHWAIGWYICFICLWKWETFGLN